MKIFCYKCHISPSLCGQLLHLLLQCFTFSLSPSLLKTIMCVSRAYPIHNHHPISDHKTCTHRFIIGTCCDASLPPKSIFPVFSLVLNDYFRFLLKKTITHAVILYHKYSHTSYEKKYTYRFIVGTNFITPLSIKSFLRCFHHTFRFLHKTKITNITIMYIIFFIIKEITNMYSPLCNWSS